MRPHDPIGVFDSGIGGLSVLRALRAELPREDFVYLSDAGHAPYGEKDTGFVAERTMAAAAGLQARHGVKALVVACNTATAACVHMVRAEYPRLTVVGVEPALKPAAALTKTGRVAVLATRGTLASARFRALHDALRDRADFVLQPCDGLAAAIEADDAARIAELCRCYTLGACRYGTAPGEVDTVVLGCTHYPFALPVLRELLGQHVALLETGQPVARHAHRLLAAAGMLNPQGSGHVQWESTGCEVALRAAASRWLGL